MEYYLSHSNLNVETSDIVDWAVQEYFKRTKSIFRDPDRQIRSLYSKGCLIKIRNGVYRYEPSNTPSDPRTQKNFTSKQKEIILKQGNYKCAICGDGAKEGAELHVDHIKPRDKGGDATIENGQILCSKHNFKKKNYNQTETAKQLFINLLKLAESKNDLKLINFCRDILKVYKKHNINGHIDWSDA